jgi:hypothetical protein
MPARGRPFHAIELHHRYQGHSSGDARPERNGEHAARFLYPHRDHHGDAARYHGFFDHDHHDRNTRLVLGAPSP